jgi:hypothetical protein
MNNQEKKIQEKIDEIKMCKGDYSKIHERLSIKRLAWWRENKDKIKLAGSLPRQAYQMVLLGYMKLKPEEVPVVYEDEKKITWRSYNFCPTLEACKKLGVDTRIVCKEGFERSIQELASCLSKKLRFSRNYETLRPYGQYCEETFELTD